MSSEKVVSLEESTRAEERVQRNETRGGWVSRRQRKLVSLYSTHQEDKVPWRGASQGGPHPRASNGEMPLSLLLE